jgi:alanyl-tRNA synthetase
MFEPDWQSQRAWRDMGLPDGHIVGLGAEHNFWKQGAGVVGREHTPKCGPNTEVFFDRGSHLSCGSACRPGCHCGRFVEFLNTLFITLHIDEHADVVKRLDDPFTETVIGAERVAMLLQDVPSVFEIDSIHPLIQQVRASTRSRHLTPADQVKHERVLVDHIRAILFLAADGAPPPGRGGRARLMRKLVREMLTSQMLLGIGDPGLIPSLVQQASSLYADQQPHLLSTQKRALNYVSTEQIRFEHTLENGRRRLDRMLDLRGDRGIGPQDAHELEIRHGVPQSLLETMLGQQNTRFNQLAFQAAASGGNHTQPGNK